MISLFLPRLISPRRRFLVQMSIGAAAFSAPGALAALVQTPRQTEGPFYPDHLPLDTDNDLIVLNDSLTPASGEIAYVSGRVLDRRGTPIRDAVVEIWQCDQNGVYLHSGSDNAGRRDQNFQGFGRFLTGSSGEYLFRTIKPVPYPGRAPHIHFKVKRHSHELLVTQCYVKDHPGNLKDGIWKEIKDAKERAAVNVAFRPMQGSRIGELTAKFDLVLGATPIL